MTTAYICRHGCEFQGNVALHRHRVLLEEAQELARTVDTVLVLSAIPGGSPEQFCRWERRSPDGTTISMGTRIHDTADLARCEAIALNARPFLLDVCP